MFDFSIALSRKESTRIGPVPRKINETPARYVPGRMHRGFPDTYEERNASLVRVETEALRPAWHV